MSELNKLIREDMIHARLSQETEERQAASALAAPSGSVLTLVSDWRKKADMLSEQLRYEPHGNYQWQLQGRAHALRDAAMELEKALNHDSATGR